MQTRRVINKVNQNIVKVDSKYSRGPIKVSLRYKVQRKEVDRAMSEQQTRAIGLVRCPVCHSKRPNAIKRLSNGAVWCWDCRNDVSEIDMVAKFNNSQKERIKHLERTFCNKNDIIPLRQYAQGGTSVSIFLKVEEHIAISQVTKTIIKIGKKRRVLADYKPVDIDLAESLVINSELQLTNRTKHNKQFKLFKYE